MSTQRHSVWSVTINNPTDADEECINLARQKGWTVDGQKERGESGTLHYQLMVKSGQQRFSSLKKAFPRAHIEPARNVAALDQYVHKEETREGELQTQSDKYPSLQKLWDLFADWLNDSALRYTRFIDADPDERLVTFDKCIRELIDRDYVVETMAVNPQIRSCVKSFGYEIVSRSLRRQTDRQTDTASEVTEDSLYD